MVNVEGMLYPLMMGLDFQELYIKSFVCVCVCMCMHKRVSLYVQLVIFFFSGFYSIWDHFCEKGPNGCFFKISIFVIF